MGVYWCNEYDILGTEFKRLVYDRVVQSVVANEEDSSCEILCVDQ